MMKKEIYHLMIKISAYILLFLYLSLFTNIAAHGNDSGPPALEPPSFSHPPGFYISAFDLHLSTSHTGLYQYKVEKEGFHTVHGEVQVVDQDIEIHITLHETPKGYPPVESRSIRSAPKSFPVTFRVDMTESPYQTGDVVYISGTMADPPWPEPGTNIDMAMVKADDDGPVYEITFQLAHGDYAYKYFLNEGWGGGEWSGDPNREVTVYGPTTFHDIWGVYDPDNGDDPDDPSEPGYSVTFVVTDSQGAPIDDAVVTFSEETYPPGQYVITGVMPAATIRYTSDGSVPDMNSTIYQGPISITDRSGDPNTISMIPTNNIGPGNPYNEHWQPPAGEIYKINSIRARAFIPSGHGSEVVTHSYLVHEEGTQRYSMPLIAINAHAGAFFNADSGIYVHGNHVNYNQRGIEWERLVHFEFFENDGNLAFSQQMGARIHGGTSRNRPRKSLRMYARSDYGTTWVNYPIFPDKNINRYKRFLLRNSGNDWGDAIFRDAFMQSLLKDLDLDIQYSRPAIVFINGEYWGVHNIRDRLDNRYIQTHYGLDDEMDYTILERNGVFERGNPDGVHHYWDMIDFLDNPGVSDPANYTTLQTMMDTDNFMDYQIAQIYVMNTDWPGNNIQFWRYYTDTYNPDAPPGLDGRWRWQVFDLDFGFGLNFDYVTGVDEGPAHNTLSFALEPNGPSWPNPPWSTFILRRLVENETFQTGFVTRFADLLNSNFAESVVVQKLESFREMYLPEMPEHIHRWRMPEDMNHWESEIDVMRNFAIERPGYLRQYLREEFDLGPTAKLHVNRVSPAQGSVRVNTIQVGESDNPWSGFYFEGLPIQLKALPAPGHRFSHWEGIENTTSPITEFILQGETEVTAYFTDGLIHYWHFNNLPEGTIQLVESDFSANTSAIITYPGTGSGYLDRTDGTIINEHHNAGAGYGLRTRNPSDTRQLTIHASSEGYQEILFSFTTQRSANGAMEQKFHYSPDAGESWIQVGDTYHPDIGYGLYTFDLEGIEEVNDNPDLRFKITFHGEEAAGSEGNNRFDNISISGTAIHLSLNKRNPEEACLHEKYPGHYFTASGGTPPYTYTISTGNLPVGMQISSNGLLAGTPEQDGTYLFTISVTDSNGQQVQRDYSLVVNSRALIHYWHFNNLPEGTLYAVPSDFSRTRQEGNISYPGTGEGYMDRTDGTMLNNRMNAGAGYGLRARNPSHTRQLLIAASSEEFENLSFSYSTHRTSNGARHQEVYYSPDGGITWNFAGAVSEVPLTFTRYSFDLSGFADANNNPELRLKIVFTGDEASGDSGNNRFDNVVMEGTRSNVSVIEPPAPAGELRLYQNYPNPFSTHTTIPFEMTEPGNVRIDVFNLHGMHIANLANGFKPAGRHEAEFRGAGYPPGIYIYRMQTATGIKSKQMIMIN
ncbi:MAG: T9SS C-terminal target domain-containing protein [Bacteroidia bacterium]|nr:MAG: T9SS C-terminal target domain-containing protein [Bacteroidia bacterium]